MARVTKSMNIISTTGLSPPMAAPTAAPTMAASEIGASLTRSGPKRSSRPRVTPNGPPAAATSSPNKTTLGSAAIASANARLIACPKRLSLIVVPGPTRIDIGQDLAGRRRRSASGFGDGRRHPLPGLPHRGFDVSGRSATLQQMPFEAHDRIIVAARRHFFRVTVLLWVAFEMAAPPLGQAFKESRATAGSRFLCELAGRGMHLEHVVTIDGNRQQRLAPGESACVSRVLAGR